ncbi:MAG: hypothetical protein ACE5Q6_07490 [Dehalococcoidia bacterium]
MTKTGRTVGIARIVLTDLGVPPNRAGHIRRMVEAELQHLLEREGPLNQLTGGEVPLLDVRSTQFVTPER